MIAAARSRGCRVAVNGADATDHAATYLAAGADAVILGEPEETMAELAALWGRDGAAALEGVRGLALAGGVGLDGTPAVRRTPVRPFLEDLDALPLPAWDLVDAEAYRAAWTRAHGRLSWNVVTTRGCPFHCNWCAKPLCGTRYAAAQPGERRRRDARPQRTRPPGPPLVRGRHLRPVAAVDRVVRRGARRARRAHPVHDAVAGRPDDPFRGRGAGGRRRRGGLDGRRVRLAADPRRDGQGDDGSGRSRRRRASCRATGSAPRGSSSSATRARRGTISSRRATSSATSARTTSACPSPYPLPGTLFYERVKEPARRAVELERQRRARDALPRDLHSAFYRRVRDLLHEEVAAFAAGTNAAAETRLACDEKWRELDETEAAHRSEPLDAGSGRGSASPARDAGGGRVPVPRRPRVRRPRSLLRHRVRGLEVRRGAAPRRPARPPRGLPARRAPSRARRRNGRGRALPRRRGTARSTLTDGVARDGRADAREGAAPRGCDGRVTAGRVSRSRSSATWSASRDAAPFDGAFSNFAALNCVTDHRAPSPAGSARVLPRGARALLVVFGPASPGEVARSSSRAGASARRSGGFARRPAPARVGGRAFPVTYPAPRAYARRLRPLVRPRRHAGDRRLRPAELRRALDLARPRGRRGHRGARPRPREAARPPRRPRAPRLHAHGRGGPRMTEPARRRWARAYARLRRAEGRGAGGEVELLALP